MNINSQDDLRCYWALITSLTCRKLRHSKNVHKVNNPSPERTKKSHLRSSNCRPELYPWGMSSVTNPFIFFQSERDSFFFPKLSLWLYMKFSPLQPWFLHVFLHPHTCQSFFFPLKKWQQNNKTKIPSTICHLYFYISHLSTNPLSISASSISNYFSFHFILPSCLNHLWTHH